MVAATARWQPRYTARLPPGDHVYRLKNLLFATALAATLAGTATAGPAHAAPDWTAPTDLRDPSHAWVTPLLGYADGGVELGAHFESSSIGGFGETVVLTRRTAGHEIAEEARIDAVTGLSLSTIAFDV